MEGGNGDKGDGIKGDSHDEIMPTAVTHEEGLQREPIEEIHTNNPEPVKADFVKSLDSMRREKGSGVCILEISSEQKEYIELKIELDADIIENKTGYRRALEKQAMAGTLDMSDLEELRERKRNLRAMRRKTKREKADKASHAKQVDEFRSALEEVEQWVRNGDYSIDDLKEKVENGYNIKWITSEKLKVILKLL